MPAALSVRIDFIEELMYRCWARRNYLPSELREQDWHPVILDEMSQRDGELREEMQQEQQWNQSLASAFVPLVPTVTHYVHPAQSEIREPHFLSAPAASSDQFTNSIYAGGLYDFSY
jgi:hypothetical protein